ncbi:MAG: DNA polymerase Y family protein [Phycisphaera sp.]|nr:DNA polymerase Y family protein [Phycisphaera sp.]
MIVFEERHGRRVVVDRCSIANECGVLPGMDVAEAEALLSNSPWSTGNDESMSPLVVRADPRRAATGLRRIAEWCLRFSPISSVDGEDGIVLDIRGCERWLMAGGGESAFLDRIEKALAIRGFATRTAIADTVITARAWSRHRPGPKQPDERSGTGGDARILSVGHGIEAIDELPIQGLGLEEVVLDRLKEIRVRRIGELRALPRIALPGRYGPSILLRLDQAMGRTPVALVPVRPPDEIAARRDFPGPIRSRDSIELALVDLLGTIHERLREVACGARMIRIKVVIPDAADWMETVELVRASRRPAHLWSVIEPVLERIPLDGGVDAIRIDVPARRRLRDRTARITTTAPDGDGDRVEARGVLVDLVQARFGREAVRRFDPRPGHVPDDQNRVSPIGVLEDDSGHRGRAIVDRAGVMGSRPDIWLDRVRSIEMEMEEGRPRTVRLDGIDHAVDLSVGPEMIGAPWWRLPDGVGSEEVKTAGRHYWKLLLVGGHRLWVFHAIASDRWYLQGLWS